MTDVCRNWVADRVVCDAAFPDNGPCTILDMIDGEGLDYAVETLGDHGHELVAYTESRVRAEFIAEARTGWPAALDEIDRNQRHISQLVTVSAQLERELAETLAEVQRYRQALESIAEYAGPLTGEDAREMRDIAEGVLADDEAAT